MKRYIVKENDGKVIFGMTPNKLYLVIGVDSKNCYVIENNFGDLISVHSDYVTVVLK